MGAERMACCGAITRVYSQGAPGQEPRPHEPWCAHASPLGSGTVAQELGKLATLAQLQKQRMDLKHMKSGEWHANLGSARRLLKQAQTIVDRLEGEAEE